MSAPGAPGAGPPVGILGGTFDPPHLAHLAIAEEAREVLGLGRVLFVPAGDPWQKSGRAVTPASVRLALVEAAIAGNPWFEADAREIVRPGPSYTVDTLEEIAREGIADPWLILSAEALAGLPTWRDPARIAALARVCVVPRPGVAGHAAGAAAELDAGAVAARFRAAFDVAPERVVVLDRPRLAISSTEIRARVRAGRSIRYLVPEPVAALVAGHALYAFDAAPVPAPPPA